MEKQKLSQKIKQHFVLFLAKQINPPPPLFFTLYIYCHLKIQSPDYIAYTFFSVGLLFALLFSYNHFYVYSPVLNGGIGYLSILNLALGLLAANQKWKLYLYLFIIGDSITMEYPQISGIYTICCAFYLCIEIHNNLVFKAVDDNVIFFSGFSTIFVFQLFKKIIESVDGYAGMPYFTVPFTIMLAYKLINNRIQKLKKEDISNIRNVQLAFHYITLIEQQIKSPYSRQGFIQSHKQACTKPTCFCHNQQITSGSIKVLNKMKFSTKVQYFYIRNLYDRVLSMKAIPKKQFLQNKFIDFLVQNNQITEAIQMFTKLQALSAKFYYFRWVQKVRLYFKIRDKLRQFDYFNAFSQQFIYAFKYDNSYLYLASQIKEILKKKVQFWKEVGKQTPLMIKLQQFGSQIVQRMYELNNFYYKDIKQQQEKINNFNGTIMYAMYLLSTTNYKEYAESLIKNTSRTLQSIKIHEDNIAQTYGLKILIRNSKKSCNEKIQNLNQIIDPAQLQKFADQIAQCSSSMSLQRQSRDRAKKMQQFYQDGFIEIISNISGSLCKLLKTSKHNMLGRDLNTIIPSSYQQRHHNKLGKLLHYDNESSKQLVNLSFVNKVRQVPLKTSDSKLITAKISVKIFQGIQQSISFIALVQTINENKVTLISNIDGQIQQYEQGLNNLKILQCQQISNVMKQLKEEWQTDKKITSRKINISFMDNNYSINFSSPYQSSFLYNTDQQINGQFGQSQDQQKRLYSKKVQNSQLTPPIHIDFTNQSIPYLMNPRQDRQEQMTKCIKKMESVFYKTDIDSQSSTNSSRKSSVVNVLSSFSQNYFIPFYGYIMGVFALVIICSVVVNSIGYSKLGLVWDNSTHLKNPIINVISVMDVRAYMIFAVNHQMDLREYRTNNLLNRSNINYFYGLDKTQYPRYVRQHMNRIKKRYKDSVSSVSMYISDVLSQKLNSVWNLLIPTINPNNPDPEKQTQYLPLQNIFMNYLVDLDLLSLGKPYSKTLISLNYWSTIEYIISQIGQLSDLIMQSIEKSILINFLYCGISAVIIIISIIPIYVLLKKRVKRHIDIYDLIVSVEGQMIKQQIKKLDNIIAIVNNSNQSSQVLKTNTINYLARKRSSAVNDNIGGSNQMIQNLIQNKNDSMTQPDAQSAISQGQQTKNGFLLTKNSKLSAYYKQKQNDQIVGQQSKKLTLRKRSGQLNLQGSQGDNKKMVCKHWGLYIMIILSVGTLFAITIYKTNYYSFVSTSFKQIQTQYSTFIDGGLLLLNAKLFFRGLPSVNFTYRGQNYANWLQKNIYLNSDLQFNTNVDISKSYPKCDAQNQIHYAFCKHSYSHLILKQQVSQFIKQSYEQRLRLNQKYNLTSTSMMNVPRQQLVNMSQYFFYVQSMKDRIVNITKQDRDGMINKIFDSQKQLDSNLSSIFVTGLSFGLICLLIGLLLINHMKKLYFKEIIIVSFLNNQMISKNKRVQSFLQTLSKSSY